ncbi:MAG: hypothetical protein PWQ82_295 [Thermosediminibacterales bacterium]|nr:hypothetical protein [Thermosediminibacterales bacterium]
MKEPLRILFMIFILGILGKNRLVACSSGLMLSLIAGNLIKFSSNYQRIFLDIGIIFLMAATLLPFASGEITTERIYKTVFTVDGFIALLIGIFATILGSKGVSLLQDKPEVMVGLVFGSILGASFFKGIPVGPLVAAGLAALLLQFAGRL